MPQNNNLQFQNNFTAGLKTEFTGLNFPENSVLETDNTVYSVIGDSVRRDGINYEINFQLNNIGVAAAAKTRFKWENVGGDGSTQMLVQQVGSTLYFYKSSSATIVNPLSTTKLASTISITPFLVSGSSADPSQYECRFASGNGYLFVYNPVCEPFYVSFDGVSTMTATQINVQIRDFQGIPEPGVAFNFRPATLSPEHQYNLLNQGWGAAWKTTSTTINTIGTGTFAWVVASSSLAIVVGDTVVASPMAGNVISENQNITGTVDSYVGNVLTITETTNQGVGTFSSWSISPIGNYITTFFNKARTGGGDFGTAQLLKKYPSNAEQWWEYRSTNVTRASPDGTFLPSATADYVVLNNNQAPQGSVILNAFNQTRSTTTGVSGLTDVTTMARPTTGTFFQGRVWYTGINAAFQAAGDMPFYTWTENIYFTQILEKASSQVGYCYQVNDPSSPDFFDILPTDGGVIYVQGSGKIFKLFPIQNGLLIFAANGIWFLTGSQGIGFSAVDYTVTKISSVRITSDTSFVDVLGFPMFWNEEGIYHVSPAQQGNGLEVNNLVIGTIATFYNNIPVVSKNYARGTYDPLNYIVQWVYRSTTESSITDRYQYDRVLLFNTASKAFYTYSYSGTTTHIHDCVFVSSPGTSTSGSGLIKYIVSTGTNFTFAEESDDVTFTDFASATPVNFVSTFTTAYMLHGKAAMKFQVPYIYMFANSSDCSYKINGQWNYSNTGNSGKWTNTQIFNLFDSNYDRLYNRLRIRGRGNVLQLKITSQDGLPFNFSGWAIYENINAGL
ncbi:MAG TPA: hypothetical protein VEP90_02825 [Methylomirabilota bacterium]|nr:hypothetical protein [Methylomirabilota bacterium]